MTFSHPPFYLLLDPHEPIVLNRQLQVIDKEVSQLKRFNLILPHDACFMAIASKSNVEPLSEGVVRTIPLDYGHAQNLVITILESKLEHLLSTLPILPEQVLPPLITWGIPFPEGSHKLVFRGNERMSLFSVRSGSKSCSLRNFRTSPQEHDRRLKEVLDTLRISEDTIEIVDITEYPYKTDKLLPEFHPGLPNFLSETQTLDVHRRNRLPWIFAACACLFIGIAYQSILGISQYQKLRESKQNLIDEVRVLTLLDGEVSQLQQEYQSQLVYYERTRNATVHNQSWNDFLKQVQALLDQYADIEVLRLASSQQQPAQTLEDRLARKPSSHQQWMTLTGKLPREQQYLLEQWFRDNGLAPQGLHFNSTDADCLIFEGTFLL